MGDWLGLLRSVFMYWRPGRQPGLRRLYRPFVQPGDLVFDVGAHLGDRSVAFAALGARVLAVEPQPRIAAWLKRIVGRNPRITLAPLAVGRAPGTARLAISRRTPTVSTLAEEWRQKLPRTNPGFANVRWEQTMEVHVTTLDALIATHGTPQFIKLDIEGYEAEALAGLSTPVTALSVEFVQGSLEVAIACIRRLQVLGTYRYNAVRGEQREFLFERWRTAEEAIRWLENGAGEAPSGDLYARICAPASLARD